MKKAVFHSKSNLFLMELIFSLLFLALSASVCIQIFAAAASSKIEAREWNHIQEWTVSIGEFLEGSPASASEFLDFYPLGVEDNDTLLYYFDTSWNPTNADSSHYLIQLTFSETTRKKTIAFSCYKKEELLYQQDFSFPIFSSLEVTHE